MELPELLALLKGLGVRSFAQGDLRVEFGPEPLSFALQSRTLLKANQADDGPPPPQDAVTAALNPPRFDPDQVDEG